MAGRDPSNDKVKAFGQRMIDDHSTAGNELKMIALKMTASKNNLTLPASLDAKQKAEVDHFSAMSAAAFDRAYMRTWYEITRRTCICKWRKMPTPPLALSASGKRCLIAARMAILCNPGH